MQAASESRGMVIAVGGGVPEPESNRLALKRLGTVVYLAADPFEIASRLSDDGLRPLLSTNSAEAKGAERSGNHPGSERSNMVSKLNGLLDRRRQAYECADIKIDTTGLSPHQIINVLQERLKTHLKI
jgi:shikimate kinase